jgi:hypothetical protein
MHTPDLQNNAGGGIGAKRGFRFEIYGLLFYLLIRLTKYPDLEVIIEPEEGEDAKFVYPTAGSNGHTQVIELIQYKKRESSQTDSSNLDKAIGDDWKEGEITPHKFKKWVTTKRPSVSTVDVLNFHENVFFTAIVFGHPTKGVLKFIPKDLPRFTSLAGYSSDFTKAFPAEYKHQADPNPPTSPFGTEAIRSRIRLLRFGSPSILDAQCRRILEDFYETSRRLSADLVDQLCIEITKRETLKGDETRRRLSGQEIKAIIATGKTEQGQWLDAKLQDSINGIFIRAEPTQLFISLDFDSGRYIHFDEYDEAWEGLERAGFIVICGAAGIGKTTLSRYLIFKFLKHNPDAKAYYLHIKPDETLEEENEFLKQHIETNTLFIIDDQHLSFDEVENLIQTFSDYHDIGRAVAKLVITSSITFGHTQRGKRRSELNRALLIHLQPISHSGMADVVKALRTRLGINTPLSDEDLIYFSNGNIGLAVILAKCSQDLPAHFNHQKLAESPSLKKSLRDWILMLIGCKGEIEKFKNEIAPIFILGTQEVPVPKDFTKSVEALYSAGFLEPDEVDFEGVKTFRPTSRRLAMLVRIQYRAQEFFAWEEFLDQHPKQLPVLCERLSNDHRGQSILLALFRERFDTFIDILNDPFRPISLDGISKVLLAINAVNQHGESSRLLRALASPKGQPRRRFFSYFIQSERIADVTSLSRFFYALHKIDRFLIRQLASAQLGEPHADFILSLFESDSCRLDQAGRCLHAIKRCSRDFSFILYQRFKLSPVIDEKFRKTESDPRNLFIWLRFCEAVRYFDREYYLALLAEYMPANKVADTFLSISSFNQISAFLLRLRRLHPKLAANIVSELWEKNRKLLRQLIANETDLSALTNDLFVLSRLNRRLTVKISSSLSEELFSLVKAEGQYNVLASSLTTLRKSVSTKLATDLTSAIDRDNLLTEIKNERQRFSLLGRSMLNFSVLSSELGWWLEKRLDYRSFTDKIQTQRIYQYTHLIRGFLSSADPSNNHRTDLLNQFLEDTTLIGELNQAWREANNLTEIAFCLSHLLDTPMMPENVIDLLGIPNYLDFRDYILERFRREKSLYHLINGLFAIAKFNFSLAVEALDLYVENFDLQNNTEKSSGDSRLKYKKPIYLSKLPQGYSSDDLVDIGCMLRLAAAIEPIQARKLAEFVDLNRIVTYAVDEVNFGRLAIFIMGLNEASRKLARDFIEHICSEEIWQKQLQENEKLENIIHYARALGETSRGKYVQFILFAFENFRKEIKDVLEVEANLVVIANWLRLLSMVEKEFASQHIRDISQLLTATTGYDTRIRQMLDASITLIGCGEQALARQFANKIIEQSSQLQSIAKLYDWIEVFHKALRIEHTLGIPDFTRRLFSETKTWYFTGYLLTYEKHSLLKAYLYNFLQAINIIGLNDLINEVQQKQGSILKSVRDERRSSFKCLGLILAKAPMVEILEAARKAVWYRQWECGLAALLFGAIFPDEQNPFVMLYDITQPELTNIQSKELNTDVNNLEFGLTLHLAAMTGMASDLLNDYRRIALERAEDETANATRWLLQQEPGIVKLDESHYYTWFYIKQTMLRPVYLNWESDLEEAANDTTFGLGHARDFEVILS